MVREGWVDQIEESTLTRMDKSYVSPDFRGKEDDLVYRMRLNSVDGSSMHPGPDVIFYVLMEM